MRSFLLSFGIVFIAEFGDKSQLMALTFAARYPAAVVLVAITIGAAVLFGLSVGVGALLGVALPGGPLAIIAGVAFLLFAVWTWRGGSDEPIDPTPRARRSAVVAIALTFVLAELGDKTMLATIALAAREGPLGTWAGATLGLVVADGLAVLVGRAVGRRISARALRLIAAAAFVVFGIVLLADGIRRVV